MASQVVVCDNGTGFVKVSVTLICSKIRALQVGERYVDSCSSFNAMETQNCRCMKTQKYPVDELDGLYDEPGSAGLEKCILQMCNSALAILVL